MEACRHPRRQVELVELIRKLPSINDRGKLASDDVDDGQNERERSPPSQPLQGALSTLTEIDGFDPGRDVLGRQLPALPGVALQRPATKPRFRESELLVGLLSRSATRKGRGGAQ